MYALSSRASGIHIRQILPAHVIRSSIMTTELRGYKCTYVLIIAQRMIIWYKGPLEFPIDKRLCEESLVIQDRIC